mgnify:CR=1 FL=1
MMPTDLPTRLARKWVEVKCSKCGSNSVWCPHPELRVAAAIREALEEAERILSGLLLDKCVNYHRRRKPENRNCNNYSCGDIDKTLVALAALRKER